MVNLVSTRTPRSFSAEVFQLISLQIVLVPEVISPHVKDYAFSLAGVGETPLCPFL